MTPAATEHAEEKTSVVHVDVAQQTAELIEQAEGTETDNSEVVFDAEAFTIYAIVYTVDFEYEVNGRIYEASFPGARDIALETVLRELGVSNKGETEYADAAEEDAAVQAFLGKIASAVSTDEEIVRVSDGTVRVLKDGDARIVITMQDGAVFSIDVSAEGETSVEAENVAISTVNDLYLPEEAAAYAEVLPEEQSESAIAAIRNEEPDPTAGTVPDTAETPVETDAAPEEHAAAETAYQVFEIRLDNVDATEYEGFRVQVTLPENIIGKDFRLYHLHEGETTDITATLEMTTVATTDNGEMEISDFSFRTDDFSQFVLQYTQYTVDFHYEINGKAYEFSIPGGGFMSLEHLAEALGLAYEDAALNEAAPENSEAENATTNEVVAVESADTEPVTDAADTALDLNAISVSEETKAFVANVANVEISDPSLLWIGKAESDITVGELKEQNAISVLYSAELTEEQIDAINAQTVEAGDWALVSILAFDTEETLTLTMTDGKQYVIRVTDARITTTVISASGETYEISVTYGADAQIHDGATLEVTEILPEDERYAAYYEQASQVALGDAESQGIELPVVEGMRMFDIEIHTDEGKIEPAAPVQVDIRLVSAKAELLSVVHFAEEGPEAMGITGQQSVETEAETTEAPEAVTEAESMSLNAMTSEVSAFDENDVPTETAAMPSAQAFNEVHFTARSFSVYTVVSVSNDNLAALAALLEDGPYALVTGIANDRGEAGYPETWGTDYFTKFVNALAMNYNYGYTLNDGIASMGVHLWEDDGQRYVGSEATEWYFESAGNGNYYIYCLDGSNKRYIYQQGDTPGGGWTPNNNLAFTPANDPNKWRTTFSVIPNNDGTVLIKNIAGNWYMHNNSYNWSGTNNEWTSRNYMMEDNPNQDALASSAYRFRLSKASEDYDSFAAKKISVQTVVPDTSGTDYQYVIYRKFEDAQGNETLYALAHDGTFVRVYDGGDSIYWRETEKDIYWKYSQSSSGGHRLYYTDSTTGQNVYINPNAASHQTMTSGEAVSLTLHGKENGDYGTTIERWDQESYDYAGLHVTVTDGVANLSAGTGGAGTSDEFLFAIVGEMPSIEQAEPVETVDSNALGIKITMFDYGEADHEYNAGEKLSEMTEIAGNEEYTPHAAHALVRKYLQNGVPVSTSNGPMTGLFDTGDAIKYKQTDVNHLFLQSYYDESGTFRYRSEDNFAYLGLNGETDFTVYRQAATPYTSNINIGHSYYYHGHFMPYNDIDMTKRLPRLLDQYGNAESAVDLPVEDGRTYEYINGIQGIPNYYVGMKMEANFSQPRNGTLDNGDDMIFKFTGDDDMWVYIDDVLVLDIGGIHEPLSGTINFATGEVTNPPGSGLPPTTTLKAIFEAALADSSTPDDVKEKIRAIEWDGNTFADYTNHSFSAFYMERGAGASNLDLQFNLKVTLTDQFTVEKELPEDVDTRYINQRYRYRATFMDGGTEKPLYAGAKNAQNEVVCTGVIYQGMTDGQGHAVPVSVDENGYFYLKPGEVAVFKMKDETIQYNVQEVGIDVDHIEKVEINGVETNHSTIISQNNTALAGYASGRDRSNVLFLNYPYLQNLLITKHLTADSAPLDDGEDPRFEFRVYLETTVVNPTGQEVRQMAYYANAPYYLVKEVNGVQHYFTLTGANNSPEDQGTTPVVCSTSGRTGTINSIPPEYTVMIPNLGTDTHFYVEEVISAGEIPEGYQYVKTELTADTYNEADSAGAVIGDTLGRIKKDKDADAHIYNKKEGTVISVKKNWQPLPNDPDASVTVELHRYAKKTKGTINVILKDTTSIQAAVVGATFKLQKLDSNGNYVDTGSNVTTDVNGKASISGLEPGTYKLVQTETPDGYSMTEHKTETDPFVVLDNVTTHQEYSEVLYNTALVTSGSLTITALDDENVPVQGAKFTLYKDSQEYQVGLETGTDGKINVGNLSAGHYYVVQTAAPEGYKLPTNTNVGAFTVETGHLGEDQHTDISVTNQGTPKGTLTVTLLKKDNGGPISGATIQLKQGDAVVETETTDKNGTVTFATYLYDGNSYTVHQVNTGDVGEAYRLANDIPVAVNPNGGAHQTITAQMEDSPKGRGTITVTLTDESDENIHYSNATIQLKQGDTVVEIGTTDNNGTVTFGSNNVTLYEGTYTVHQDNLGNAPEGYATAADQNVTIAADGGTDQHVNVTLRSGEAAGNVTIKLWRKQGTAEWNWELLKTYTGLKSDKPYSFVATVEPSVYNNHIWYYQDAQDHQGDGDAINPGQIKQLNAADWNNGTYRFTITPEQDNTTYTYVLLTDWDIKSISKMEMDSSNSLSINSLSTFSMTKQPSVAVPSGNEQIMVLSAMKKAYYSGNSATLTPQMNLLTAATGVTPTEPPEGYVEDSSFTPISYTLTSADDNWQYTFPAQAKVDADGNPYYYYVVETACNLDTYELTGYENDPLSSDGTIEITNTRKQSNLQVTKTVKLNASTDSTHGGENLTFYVGLFRDATTVAAIDGTVRAINVESGSATGSVVYENLDIGSSYYVYETDAQGHKLEAGQKNNGYFVTVSGGQSAPITLTPIVNVDVENERRTGDLELTKKVAGDGADTTKEFEFTITLTAPNGETLAENYSFLKNGDPISEGITYSREAGSTTANITGIKLKHDEVFVVKDLPDGTGYLIYESDYSSEGYSSTIPATGMEGSITGGASAKAAVTVTNTLSAGNLTVEKTVEGNSAETDKQFAFTVVFSKAGVTGNAGTWKKGTEETIETAESTDITFDSGTATVTFSLGNGEEARFINLPTGTSFTVSENSADEKGYETIVSSTGGIENEDKTVTGTISSETAVTASYVNKKETTEAAAGKEWKSGEQTIAWPEDVEKIEFTLYKTVNEVTSKVEATDLTDYMTQEEVAQFKNPTEITATSNPKKASWNKLPVKYWLEADESADPTVEAGWYEATYSIRETKIVYTEASGKEIEEKDLPAEEGIITNEIEKVQIQATKQWKDKNGTVLDGSEGKEYPADAEVTFTLVKNGEEDPTHTVVVNGVDETENGTVTPQKKDYEGENWTAYFTELPKYTDEGKLITYTVKETVKWTGYAVVGEDTVSDKETIINQESSVDINIRKVDGSNGVTPLTGAKFVLKRFDKDYLEALESWDEKEVSSEAGKEGTLSFEKLTIGYYELVETKTPDGYIKSSSNPRFEIKEETDGSLKVVFTDTNMVTYKAENQTFTVKNEPGTALPQTGGIGTKLFTALGGLMTATAGAILTIRRKRKPAEV